MNGIYPGVIAYQMVNLWCKTDTICLFYPTGTVHVASVGLHLEFGNLQESFPSTLCLTLLIWCLLRVPGKWSSCVCSYGRSELRCASVNRVFRVVISRAATATSSTPSLSSLSSTSPSQTGTATIWLPERIDNLWCREFRMCVDEGCLRGTSSTSLTTMVMLKWISKAPPAEHLSSQMIPLHVLFPRGIETSTLQPACSSTGKRRHNEILH